MDIRARHDLSPDEIETIEERLYDHNRQAVGRDDGEGLSFVLHDDDGRLIGAIAGYTWAGISEIRQMWVDPAWRGRGHGRALLEAAIAEAKRRGVSRIWLASYDFQAPTFYERAGFERVAELDDWPEGWRNIILCKRLE
jgi:N-acetylglutamate synthase-like GNAT family acetyltransferase